MVEKKVRSFDRIKWIFSLFVFPLFLFLLIYFILNFFKINTFINETITMFTFSVSILTFNLAIIIYIQQASFIRKYLDNDKDIKFEKLNNLPNGIFYVLSNFWFFLSVEVFSCLLLIILFNIPFQEEFSFLILSSFLLFIFLNFLTFFLRICLYKHKKFMGIFLAFLEFIDKTNKINYKKIREELDTTEVK
ncbi:MAG: hypothetical protein WC356_07505 [Candidatus Micrarchaeia archaeon]|jgi:uncharacterized membrane protein YccF (DUF307 family)